MFVKYKTIFILSASLLLFGFGCTKKQVVIPLQQAQVQTQHENSSVKGNLVIKIPKKIVSFLNQKVTLENYQIELPIPEGWNITSSTDGTIMMFPPGKKADKEQEYSGDISIHIYRNPDHLATRQYFSQQTTNSDDGIIPYFDEASGVDESVVTDEGQKSIFFKDIPGMVTGNVGVIDYGDWYLEVYDVQGGNWENGILFTIIKKIKSTYVP